MKIWPHRRATLVAILVAGSCAAHYGSVFYQRWNKLLEETPFSAIFGSTRSAQWYMAAIGSTFSQFPAYASGMEPLFKQNSEVKLSQYRREQVPVADSTQRGLANIGDDMLLHWVGLVLYRVFAVDNIFRWQAHFGVGLVVLSMFFALFVLCRTGAWYAALALAVAYIGAAQSAGNNLWIAPWQVYEYIALVPLLACAAILALLRARRPWGNDVKKEPIPVRLKRWSTLALGTVLVALAAITLNIRTSGSPAVYVLLVLLGMHYLVSRRLGRHPRPCVNGKRLFLMGIAATALILVGNSLIPELILPREYKRISTTSHSVWHTIWCSLGEFPNKDLPFTWSDYEAGVRATRVAGHAPANTEEYEGALRTDVANAFKQHPSAMLEIFRKKLAVDFEPFLKAVLTVLAGFLIYYRLGTTPYLGKVGRIVLRSLLPLLWITAGLLSIRAIVVLAAYMGIYTYPVDIGKKLASYLLPLEACGIGVIVYMARDPRVARRREAVAAAPAVAVARKTAPKRSVPQWALPKEAVAVQSVAAEPASPRGPTARIEAGPYGGVPTLASLALKACIPLGAAALAAAAGMAVWIVFAALRSSPGGAVGWVCLLFFVLLLTGVQSIAIGLIGRRVESIFIRMSYQTVPDGMPGKESGTGAAAKRSHA